MKYEVIRYFTDAQDNEYAYHEGDTYPRDGLNVSEQRINDLMSGNNFQKVSLIKKSDNKTVKKTTSLTKEDVQKMPYMKLKSIAKANGVDIEDKKADAIRSELIEKLEI